LAEPRLVPRDEDLTPDAIRALRHRLGLTQAELAARLSCSTQAVSFWERGTRRPTGLYAHAVRRLLAETTAGSRAEESDPTRVTRFSAAE